ncbi:MAG: hypothetical protein OHK0045_23600 [Raineya sp.]
MKKIFFLLILAALFTTTYGQSSFEKAKIEILCQAIRFNHIMQNKAEIANKLDCSSIETMNKSLPNASRASKNILAAYKNKTYPNIAEEIDKIKKLKKDILSELKKLAPRISKSADFQAQWQRGLDSLSAVLDQSLSLPNEEALQVEDKTPENKETKLEETIIPYERDANKLPNPEAGSNTGLWIISILAVLISFLSVGYAYITQKTSTHKLQEMEKLLKERYNHLDTRIDKMLTREEFRKQNPSL